MPPVAAEEPVELGDKGFGLLSVGCAGEVAVEESGEPSDRRHPEVEHDHRNVGSGPAATTWPLQQCVDELLEGNEQRVGVEERKQWGVTKIGNRAVEVVFGCA